MPTLPSLDAPDGCDCAKAPIDSAKMLAEAIIVVHAPLLCWDDAPNRACDNALLRNAELTESSSGACLIAAAAQPWRFVVTLPMTVKSSPIRPTPAPNENSEPRMRAPKTCGDIGLPGSLNPK
jgi:hypothetical protein